MRWPVESEAIPRPAKDGVTLNDIRPDDLEPLHAVLADAAIWEFLPRGRPESPATLGVRLRKAPFAGWERAAFVIRQDDDIVGSTSFMWDPAARDGVEIGGTYLSPRVWATGLNGAVKQALVAGAFDAGARWVRLRTDERNERSARAIAKIPGVVEQDRLIEPTLIRADGSVRISRVFLIRRPAAAGGP